LDIIDIGVNLEHDSFDADRKEVINRAVACGVTTMIVTGSNRQSSIRARELTTEYPGLLYSTAGIHPHHASERGPDDHEWITGLIAEDSVVAVGECGLDFFRNFSPQADQESAFRDQLEIASNAGLPVFLHQRGAHERFINILGDHIRNITGGIAHCFTGSRSELEDCLNLGLSIGITGWICDERRGSHLAELVQHIPRDRIMIETDAPYLLPRDLDQKPKTRRNEPMYLAHVLETVARHMECETSELAAATTANARRLFGLPEPMHIKNKH
jgi:TatD DNase family protein